MPWVFRILGALLLVAGAIGAKADQSKKDQVSVMLVLATDVSGSISDGSQPADGPGLYIPPANEMSEWHLQRDGIIAALSDPEVGRMLESCNTNGLGITYLEWAGSHSTVQAKTVLDWTKVKTAAELKSFAEQLKTKYRSFSGDTDIVGGLSFAAEQFAKAPFTSVRKIIDISGDGKQNVRRGVDPESRFNSDNDNDMVQKLVQTRDAIVESGITINALVIMNDGDNSYISNKPIDVYFDEYVRGGRGSFIVPVGDFRDFKEGLKRKLLLELNNCII